MAAIDTAILDAIEWVCHRFQILTGRTNVWLAIQLTNLSVILYFVGAATYIRRASTTERIGVGIACGVLLYVLFKTVLKDSVELAEHNAYHRVAKGLRNPRRLRDAPLRISFLTLSVVLLYPVVLVPMLHVAMVFLGYSLVLLTTVLLYVVGCDPLPPCASKLRQWLTRAMPSRVGVPSPEVSEFSTCDRISVMNPSDRPQRPTFYRVNLHGHDDSGICVERRMVDLARELVARGGMDCHD